jgi:hypothetical protein
MGLAFSAQVAVSLSYERENRIRDVLRAMGLKDAPYYVSWFISGLSLPIASITLICIFFLFVPGAVKNINVPLFAYWLILALGIYASIGMTFLIGVILSTPQAVQGVTTLLLVGPLYGLIYGLPWQMRVYLSYIPFFCLDSGLLAGSHLGGVWTTSDEFRYSMGYAIVFLACEGTVFFILSLYLDQVLPRNWGPPPRPPLFFFGEMQTPR